MSDHPGECIIPRRTAEQAERARALSAAVWAAWTGPKSWAGPEAYIPLTRRTTEKEGPRGLV